jgi:hypothetical protein
MKLLKRFALITILCALAVPAWAATVRLSASDDVVQIGDNSDLGFNTSCRFSQLESYDVQTVQGPFSSIRIPGLSNSNVPGQPALPVVRRLIWVPVGATVTAEAANYTVEEITLAAHGIPHPLMPAQPSLAKNQNPASVPFAYNPAAYAAVGYGDSPIVRVEEVGFLRGMRICALVVEPVRYDPSAQSLLIYNQLQIRVNFSNADLNATHRLRARTASPYFESIYAGSLFNYRRDSSLDEDLTRYPIKYVIVSDPMFQTQLQSFIQWKIKKGFSVVVGYTNDPQVGTTTTSIKNYLQTLYNAGTPQNPAPTFVLFVGDVAQIPAYTGSAGSHSTDLNYARLNGTDILPDIYYGRFSASNTADLQPQIDKTLEYERYLMPDPAFLGEAIMIAGVDGSYGQVWANGQINYGTENYFNAAHGIASHTHLYPGSGSQDAQIIAEVSDGAGYVNYTAHGSETS